MTAAARDNARRNWTGMKTKLAPQFRTLPVKWEKENPIELLVLAQGHARYSNARTINLLRELQAHQPVTLAGPRRVSGGA